MNEHLQNLAERESEFTQEMRGDGSLSPFVAQDASNFSKAAMRDGEFYVGFDIHLEDLEGLFFEDLKILRWEQLPPGKSIEEKQEMCRKSLEECTANYPLISKVTDTTQRVRFTPEEALRLRQECETALNDVDNPRAVRALQKFYIACDKAAGGQMGLVLIPSSFGGVI